MELGVRLASGRGCRVLLPAAARLRDLKAAAQRRLGRRFLRFAARGAWGTGRPGDEWRGWWGVGEVRVP